MIYSKVSLLLTAAILCGSCLWSGGVEAAAAAVTAAATTAKPATTTTTPSTTPKPATTATVSTTAAATTKPALTTTSSAAPTTEKFVPFPESQCNFPFWHSGCWHHTCVKYNDFGDYWCSLSSNFTKDENWRRCRSADLKRFQCHIPFEYQGKNHTECLPLETGSTNGGGAHHGFWCGVVPKILSWTHDSPDWAYCEHKDAIGVAYLKAVGTRHSIPAEKLTGALPSHAEAAAASAAAAKAPVKSLNGGAASQSGSGAAAGLGAQATVGISVGVVCSVLAVVAVIAGVAIRRRRRSGKDRKSLLESREKGTYGGMEASD